MSHSKIFKKRKTVKSQIGSSLIEVMVALFILAIGLLGILSMQVKSMQFNQSAYYYSQAVYLANEILESMRSNTQVVDTYLIGMEDDLSLPGKNCNLTGFTCSPSELKDLNLYEWRENIADTLISGKSSIERVDEFIAIRVQFDDSRSDSLNGEDSSMSEYVLVTEIN